MQKMNIDMSKPLYVANAGAIACREYESGEEFDKDSVDARTLDRLVRFRKLVGSKPVVAMVRDAIASVGDDDSDAVAIVNTGGPFFNVVRNGEVLTKRTIKGRDAAIAWAEERGLTVVD